MKRPAMFDAISCYSATPKPHSMSFSLKILVSPLKTAHACHRLVSKDIEWGMGVRMKKLLSHPARSHYIKSLSTFRVKC